MSRRVGRYTKYETAELTRMFGEGYSIYKICRNLKRSQNSIRNNLIRLGLMEGEVTPRRYSSKINEELQGYYIIPLILNSTWNIFVWLFFTLVFVLNPQYNILEIMLVYIFMII